MKLFKKIAAILAAGAIFTTASAFSLPTVSAEEPARHSVKYVASLGEWRYQPTTTWDDSLNGVELYYLKELIKDGDVLLVIGTGSGLKLELDVTLGNMTYLNCDTSVIVTAKGAKELFVLRDSTGIFNGDVDTAYVYENAICNLNNNVNQLIVNAKDTAEANIGVLGTLNCVTVNFANNSSYSRYNFKPNTFRMANGTITTDPANFSTTPPAAAEPAPAPAPTTPDSEYDEVPKTGDSYMGFVLLAAAAIFFAGSYSLRNQKRSLR